MNYRSFFQVSVLCATTAGIAHANGLTNVQFLKIAPQDQKAIIKTPDGKLKVIKQGDAIGESAKVIEIIEGRIVLEETTERGVETVIIHLENGKQRIERLRKQGEGQTMPVAPQSPEHNK